MNLDGFSPAELSALRLDGHAFAIAAGFIAADEPLTFVERVRLARGGAPTAYILDLRSAAWAWGALATPPQRAQFCQDRFAKGSDRIGSVRAAHYVGLADGDVVHTAAGPVLSVWRTAVHLMRWESDQMEPIRALLARAELTPSAAAERIRSEFAPNQWVYYLRGLQRVASYASVTR